MVRIHSPRPLPFVELVSCYLIPVLLPFDNQGLRDLAPGRRFPVRNSINTRGRAPCASRSVAAE